MIRRQIKEGGDEQWRGGGLRRSRLWRDFKRWLMEWAVRMSGKMAQAERTVRTKRQKPDGHI